MIDLARGTKRARGISRRLAITLVSDWMPWMDGFVRLPIDQKDATPGDISSGCRQRTLKAAINCVGVGIHSGRRVTLTIRPADADHGIVFHRTDLNRVIAAHVDNVAIRACAPY